MILKDKIKEMIGVNQEMIEEYFSYNMIGSYFNFMEDAVEELMNPELTKKFEEMQDIIRAKRKELENTELTALTGFSKKEKLKNG